MTEVEELQLRVQLLHLELRNYQEHMERKLAIAKQFQDAVIDELVCIGIYCKEHDTNAAKALDDAIMWNVDVALDPKVSKAAQMLISQGYDRGWNDSTVGDNW